MSRRSLTRSGVIWLFSSAAPGARTGGSPLVVVGDLDDGRGVASARCRSWSRCHAGSMDTNSPDVLAMEPLTCRWVRCELTVAMDLYSRYTVGLRLTPVSTKSVDAAGVLYETARPREARAGSGEPLPYAGVPSTVVVDAEKLALAMSGDHQTVPPQPFAGVNAFAGDAADDPLAPQLMFPQVGDVVGSSSGEDVLPPGRQAGVRGGPIGPLCRTRATPRTARRPGRWRRSRWSECQRSPYPGGGVRRTRLRPRRG